jgi:putative ABC transport system ATP-binding protein
MPRAARRERAREVLASVGLSGRESHTPAELSGGQQQRVAIARALVADPQLLLADEPTGNLDSATSREILALLERLNRQRGVAIVLVTHDPEVAAAMRRHVRFVDGRIAEDRRQGEAL